MTVLVTGVAGQLGYDVVNELAGRGIVTIGADVKEENEIALRADWDRYVLLDITDGDAVAQTLRKESPDAIIHCAAWTDVDRAEDESNREKVRRINVDGTGFLAEAAKNLGCKFLYISTDYVFNGEGTDPLSPDCKDFAPLNYYGETKLAGESIVSSRLERFFIVRIAWVFGKNGKNFIQTMLNLSKTHDSVRVVYDQIGTPTYTVDLARLLADMIESDRYGFYHATNEGGYISWYDLACEVFRQAGVGTRVIPVTTAEYGVSVAGRPRNSRLDKSKLTEAGFTPLPDWKNAVARYLKEIGVIE